MGSGIQLEPAIKCSHYTNIALLKKVCKHLAHERELPALKHHDMS